MKHLKPTGLNKKKIQDAVLLLKDKGYKVYKEDEQTS